MTITNDENEKRGVYKADWALVTGNKRFLDLPEVRGAVNHDDVSTRTMVWTDQYSNLVRVLNAF